MGHQLCERARTSGMHRQTEGRMDGELTEQNIERYRERERGGGGGEGGEKKTAEMCVQFEEGDGGADGRRRRCVSESQALKKKPVPVLCVSAEARSSQNQETAPLASGAASVASGASPHAAATRSRTLCD